MIHIEVMSKRRHFSLLRRKVGASTFSFSCTCNVRQSLISLVSSRNHWGMWISISMTWFTMDASTRSMILWIPNMEWYALRYGGRWLEKNQINKRWPLIFAILLFMGLFFWYVQWLQHARWWQDIVQNYTFSLLQGNRFNSVLRAV